MNSTTLIAGSTLALLIMTPVFIPRKSHIHDRLKGLWYSSGEKNNKQRFPQREHLTGGIPRPNNPWGWDYHWFSTSSR